MNPELITHKKSILILILLFLAMMIYIPEQAWSEESGMDILILRIPCKKGEMAYALVNNEQYSLGEVLSVPSSTRWPSYTASKWGHKNSVCATAVNAIHLLVNIENGRGRTLSILPSGTYAPASGESSFFTLSGKPGSGLFGPFSPTVGSSCTVISSSGNTRHLPSDGLFFPDETLMIVSHLNMEAFLIDIENRPGGRVLFWDEHGLSIIGRVIRPVGGIGRFGGTQFQDVGRIRANHTGVIDISTSPEGTIGGFQILPLSHARSEEMKNAWLLTQWMIIASPEGITQLSGEPPLFSGLLKPGTNKKEELWDIWSSYLGRSHVLCRKNGAEWVSLPVTAGRNDSALSGITHLRIYIPLYSEPLFQ